MEVLVLGILCLASTAFGVDVSTAGASGELCDGVRCLTEKAFCDNSTNKCVCDPDKKFVALDGEFQCYTKNKVFAEIRSDPSVRTFDGFEYELRLPCRFLMTHIVQTLKIGKARVGECECQVHAWNKKHRGKFYPAGFDVACEVRRTKSPYTFTAGAAIRKEGLGTNGVYQFTELGSNGYNIDGPWTPTAVNFNRNGVKIQCEYDQINNFATVNIKACGLRVALRPLDTSDGIHQDQPNGISVAVNCAHQPRFLSNDRVMATVDQQWGGVPFAASILPGLSPEESFLFRALTSNVAQNHPDASQECQTLSYAAAACSTRELKVMAMRRCLWLFRGARFIRCTDRSTNADGFLRLLRRCFQAACQPGVVSCSSFVQDLRATNCIQASRSSRLQQYLSGQICQ